jgi:hypothetical protein
MHAVLECMKRDSSALVMRVVASNAVLRFSPEDMCLEGASVGTRVAVDALSYDNNRKVVVCRSAAAGMQDAQVADGDAAPSAKRVRF